MPYVSTAERIGMEKGVEKGFKKGLKKGLEQGLREAIKDVLEVRFEKITPQIIAKLDEIKDVAQLKELHKRL